MSESATEQRPYRWTPNTPIPPFRLRNNALEEIATSEQTLRNPEGRTAATDKGELDEYSDENIRRWEVADKLDPELAQWVKAQLEE